MSQRNSRHVAAALTLAVFLSVLPFSELDAAPRVRSPRGQDLWQRVEQQVSQLLGGVGRVWQKVGARIDDNGFRFRLGGAEVPDDGLKPAEGPTPPER
ncbi:MAG TPA: hypothetical protein VEL74_00030 [Thermoanaerobaculia bacterium]|nr:hypothetical protein [Thermoanaerobaculia bacterium]